MSGGLVDYTLPKAALDEILIEKTPNYSLGQGLKLRSELIGISNSDFIPYFRIAGGPPSPRKCNESENADPQTARHAL